MSGRACYHEMNRTRKGFINSQLEILVDLKIIRKHINAYGKHEWGETVQKLIELLYPMKSEIEIEIELHNLKMGNETLSELVKRLEEKKREKEEKANGSATTTCTIGSKST